MNGEIVTDVARKERSARMRKRHAAKEFRLALEEKVAAAIIEAVRPLAREAGAEDGGPVNIRVVGGDGRGGEGINLLLDTAGVRDVGDEIEF
jgi:hypothetical protein